MYYLNARYYDPEIGRFISADDNLEGGLNLYSYCLNNPVNFVDYDGELPRSIVNAANRAFKNLSALKRTDVLNYEIYKAAICVAGTTFLEETGMPVSKEMFRWGMYGGGKEMTQKMKNMLIESLKKSDTLREKIVGYINATNKNHKHNFNSGENDSIEFEKGDLHYCIQKARVWLSGYWVMGSVWRVNVKLQDTYDFTEFRKGLSFSDVANNLGHTMETNGMMTSYNVLVDYKDIITI